MTELVKHLAGILDPHELFILLSLIAGIGIPVVGTVAIVLICKTDFIQRLADRFLGSRSKME